jgi:hypothetical protein
MHLATFIHISDLHFGLSDPDSFDARVPLWVKFPYLDGLLGHSYRSLLNLEVFFAQLQREEQAQLIVTGDLTTVGNEEEFKTADEFLGAILRPPKGNYIGLQQGPWRSMAIPGNHDHWPGYPVIFGRPTAALKRNFPKLPSCHNPPIRLSSGHDLRFLRIDTDANVWEWGSNRFFARGAFTLHLKELASKLSVPGRKEIRVLCLHHSRANTRFRLGIDHASRSELDDFLVDHDVAVLLCGHMHDPPLLESFPVTHLTRSVEVLEARCGTTAQQSPTAGEWRRKLGYRPSMPNHWPNSLIVHRLKTLNNEVLWTSEIYFEGPHGFRKPQSPPFTGNSQKTVKVWPRP